MKARTRINREYISLCPFCGSNAIMVPEEAGNGGRGWRIFCTSCRCGTPPMATGREAMKIWNQRTDYSRLNWKLRKLYESLFARVAQYARAIREVYERNPKAVGAIIDDLFDFAAYFSDPQNAKRINGRV